MSVSIKTAREIDLMREAGRLLEKVHNELAKVIRPGISTWEIDHIGEKLIRDLGYLSTMKWYMESPPRIIFSGKGISSAWMPGSFTRDFIPMRPGPMRWDRSALKRRN